MTGQCVDYGPLLRELQSKKLESRGGRVGVLEKEKSDGAMELARAGCSFLSISRQATMLPMAFEIRYSTKAVKQLRGCRAFDRATILDEIERTLSLNPTLRSKAKVKKLRQPAPTQFRLRVGNFRVFYDIDEANNVVNVVQILSKADSFRYLEGSHED